MGHGDVWFRGATSCFVWGAFLTLCQWEGWLHVVWCEKKSNAGTSSRPVKLYLGSKGQLCIMYARIMEKTRKRSRKPYIVGSFHCVDHSHSNIFLPRPIYCSWMLLVFIYLEIRRCHSCSCFTRGLQDSIGACSSRWSFFWIFAFSDKPSPLA